MNVQLIIDVPLEAFSVLRTSREEFARELKLAAVCKWYELGMVSQGKGAALAGVSRSEFLQILSRYKVSPFQTSPDELDEEARRG
jgi:predicted HTH domain antitoxin